MTKVPGIYTNFVSEKRKVQAKGLALAATFVDAQQGSSEAFEFARSSPELEKYFGKRGTFFFFFHYQSAQALLDSSHAAQILRVNKAGTSALAKVFVDAGSSGGGGDGSGGDGGGVLVDSWFTVPILDHITIAGAGSKVGSVLQSGLDSGNTKIVFTLESSSIFVASKKLRLRITHNVPFPIQLIIADSVPTVHTNLGYAAEAEINFGAQALQTTGNFTTTLTVLGVFPFEVSKVEAFIKSTDVEAVNTALGL